MDCAKRSALAGEVREVSIIPKQIPCDDLVRYRV